MLALLPLLLLSQADAPTWQKLDAPTGVTLEKRALPGSDFAEFQAAQQMAAETKAACQRIFEWATSTSNPSINVRKVLKDGPDEKIVYDQIQSSLVSNRDYAMTLTKVLEPTGCRIDFQVTNEHAPAVPSGFVRITKLKGRWTLQELPNNRTAISYRLHAEPAGSVPAFLVNGAQKDKMVSTLREAVKVAQK